jgi:protein-S-isoprenylcysteine O-methyltransferase Ste14
MPDPRALGLQRRMRDLPGRRTDPADALVIAQGLAIAGLLWPGRSRWRLPRVVRRGALAVTLAGAALGGAGLRELGSGATPRVEPPEGAPLRTRGLYAVSRNPVYAGLLVAGAGFAVLRRRGEPLLAAAALAGVLHLKVGIEERRLRARFGQQYDRYTERTPRLVGLPVLLSPSRRR